MTDPQRPTDDAKDPGEQPESGGVPYGVSIDDRPPPKPSRAATNDAEDRRRAFLLIGSILCGVLLAVVLGLTVLKPYIVAQRERTLIRITSDQLDELADIIGRQYREQGVLTLRMQELLMDQRLETSQGRDLWGTPFVLSTEDAGEDGQFLLIVRSAGPDREFGTTDDLVVERLLSSLLLSDLEN